MFIDSAKIYVKAGDGGRGCTSHYRDKYTRHGVPDGGDGGKGADIIVRVDRNLYTLLDYRYNQHFYGKHGSHGSGNNKKGKDAENIVIYVPAGTVIKDLRSDSILRDMKVDGEEVTIVQGGRGGLGNGHRHLTEGKPGQLGEEKDLLLDLKVIADAGVVGFPNAGKSTLISGISNAHPQVAAYPFTTKSPVLGVVKFHEQIFTIADIPGLIEGSADGKGLGDKFLRHVERTKILVHMVDMAGFEGRNPVEDYKTINAELKKYSVTLAKKTQIVVANKMDLDGAWDNLERFKKVVKKKIYPISALKRDGLEDLVEAISKKL